MNGLAKSIMEQRANLTILQRIATGDQTAVQDCLDRYGNLLWYLAEKFFGTSEEKEDAVQEISIAIWQNAGRFDPEKGKEVSFVTLIARRRLIDRLRRKMGKPEMQMPDNFSVRCPQNYEKQIQICLEAEHAKRIMNHFNPHQRKVLNMAIYEGYTHTEIAKALEMPLGTVKTLLSRGFQKMRRPFEQKAYSQPATARKIAQLDSYI